MSESQRIERFTHGLQSCMSHARLKRQPFKYSFLNSLDPAGKRELAGHQPERKRGVAFSPPLQPCCWRGWRRRCPGGRDCLHGDLPVLFNQRRGSLLWSWLFSSKDAQASSDWATGQVPAVFFFFNHRRLKTSYILYISNIKDTQRRRVFYNQVVCVAYLRPIGLSHLEESLGMKNKS